MILNKEPYGQIKNKSFTIGLNYLKGYIGSSATITPTAVNIGSISYLSGVAGLDQDKVLGLVTKQVTLTPAACLVFGFYNDNLYVAATQNTVISSDLNINITYTE